MTKRLPWLRSLLLLNGVSLGLKSGSLNRAHSFKPILRSGLVLVGAEKVRSKATIHSTDFSAQRLQLSSRASFTHANQGFPFELNEPYELRRGSFKLMSALLHIK